MNVLALLQRVRRRVDTFRAYLGWYPVARNVNRADPAHVTRRALLLYRIKPFQLPDTHPEFLKHHNMRRSKRIAAILGEFGYIVDAANGRQARFTPPSGTYDLVLSDRASLRTTFPRRTTTVFLSTVPAHPVHNARMRARYARLAERRQRTLKPDRVYGEHMGFVERASAVIGIGNDATAGSWRTVTTAPIHLFNNYALVDTRYVTKDFSDARKHFLFFASRTQVQKGLDLLLEIFPKYPDLHLHVCSMFQREPEFVACYQRELFRTPNVHPVGWITVNGRPFYELIRRSAYIIHPSCAEGQASSVVQCMYAGLIPMVTKETGIDLDDVGVTFADDRIETIERAIVDIAARPPAWHEAESLRTRERAEREHSEAAFTDRWRTILTDVLGHPPVPRDHAPRD